MIIYKFSFCAEICFVLGVDAPFCISGTTSCGLDTTSTGSLIRLASLAVISTASKHLKAIKVLEQKSFCAKIKRVKRPGESHEGVERKIAYTTCQLSWQVAFLATHTGCWWSTSSQPDINRSTSSYLHICRSSLALLLFSLKAGQCRRSATKRNSFAQNGRWTAKTKEKLRLWGVPDNPFARNGRWTSKTEEKLRQSRPSYQNFRHQRDVRQLPSHELVLAKSLQFKTSMQGQKQQLKQDLKETNKTVKVQQQKKIRLMKAAQNLHDDDLLWLLRASKLASSFPARCFLISMVATEVQHSHQGLPSMFFILQFHKLEASTCLEAVSLRPVQIIASPALPIFAKESCCLELFGCCCRRLLLQHGVGEMLTPLQHWLRCPRGSVGRASLLSTRKDCRWWFDSLLVHAQALSGDPPKGNGHRPKKRFRCDIAGGMLFSVFTLAVSHDWTSPAQFCFGLLMRCLFLSSPPFALLDSKHGFGSGCVCRPEFSIIRLKNNTFKTRMNPLFTMWEEFRFHDSSRFWRRLEMQNFRFTTVLCQFWCAEAQHVSAQFAYGKDKPVLRPGESQQGVGRKKKCQFWCG